MSLSVIAFSDWAVFHRPLVKSVMDVLLLFWQEFLFLGLKNGKRYKVDFVKRSVYWKPVIFCFTFLIFFVLIFMFIDLYIYFILPFSHFHSKKCSIADCYYLRISYYLWFEAGEILE